ncbi:MAG: type II CRISPR RNA-guided endonuclease Cas9 [Oscillospiraceae bacterium]|jgi:CRISPR-associated endonuclease Csn1|nr:type II CRISPR RNA-guided endonuclease Cas9 [Oscillospiraceae bacterium]
MYYGIGLDIGIASVGFAAVEVDANEAPLRILSMGSRIFDTPENPKDGASLALPRREARSLRRRLRRKRHRKERIRSLILSEKLLSKEELEQLYEGKNLADIYELRTSALDRLISRFELARIIMHLSQRRGFKSNRKGEKSKEDGALLTAVEQNKARMEAKGYRTVGELLYKDADFAAEKRNKAQNYKNTVTRAMIEDEVKAIFKAQRSFGSQFAGERLEQRYLGILLSQRSFDEGPGAGSPYAGDQIQRMRGYCTFFPEEQRAPKASYSFEYFAFLGKINNLKIQPPTGAAVEITPDQRKALIDLAHRKGDLTLVDVRKELKLGDEYKFNFSRTDGDDKKAKLPSLKAYNEMRKTFEGLSKGSFNSISIPLRNKIAEIFTLYKTDERLRGELGKLELQQAQIEALIERLPSFAKFGHLSVKALDMIIPHMEQGLKYDAACTAAGIDFKAHGKGGLDRYISLRDLADEADNTITSPVGKRALSQSAKVLNALIKEMGEAPVFVHIELARELAKIFDERRKLLKSNEENQARNSRIMDDIRDTYHIYSPRGQDLVKYKLYEQQGGVCPYSQRQLDRARLFDAGYVDIDHIIPYSICFDDSYNNKVLVLAEENRQKGARLPLEYLEGRRRENYLVWVNSTSFPLSKKRKLLKEEITEEDEAKFKERNLQDTKTIAVFFYNYLKDHLELAPSPRGRKTQIRPVNGAVTADMRKRWGLKKVRENGDLHHAVDAVVIACTTDSMISNIKQYSETKENEYVQDENGSYLVNKKTGEVWKNFPQPWYNFRKEIDAWCSNDPQKQLRELHTLNYTEEELEKIRPVFVSRMPRRKVTGAAHKETIKSSALREENLSIKKVSLTALKLDKNGEIDGYYDARSDRLLYEALKRRLNLFKGNAAEAFKEAFYKPKSDGSQGPLVKKVKICEKSTLTVDVHDGKGIADNGGMVRTDVFYVKGEGYYLVPIYVADTIKKKLPQKAVVGGKPHDEWKEMKDEDFIFSLYPNDLIYIKGKKKTSLSKTQKNSTLPDKTTQDGVFVYYKGLNIANGNIAVINHDNSYCVQSLGVKTLVALEKHQVELLGKHYKVKHEKRMQFKFKHRRKR